jgi:RNA polymerase sigma-70 factor (ECF subfamily)
MSDQLPEIEQLLRQAREDREKLGDLLQRYQPYLMLMAQQRIGPKLAVRSEPADAVQQTFAEVHRSFDDFLGATEPEFSAWIKRIHRRNLEDLVRLHVRSKSRSVEQEQPLFGADGTVSLCWHEAAADQSTPSRRLVKGERAFRLAAMLQSLPELQREALRLRHLEGYSLEEIAQELDRTAVAAAALIKRGLQTLRDKMSEDSWL